MPGTGRGRPGGRGGEGEGEGETPENKIAQDRRFQKFPKIVLHSSTTAQMGSFERCEMKEREEMIKPVRDGRPRIVTTMDKDGRWVHRSRPIAETDQYREAAQAHRWRDCSYLVVDWNSWKTWMNERSRCLRVMERLLDVRGSAQTHPLRHADDITLSLVVCEAAGEADVYHLSIDDGLLERIADGGFETIDPGLMDKCRRVHPVDRYPFCDSVDMVTAYASFVDFVEVPTHPDAMRGGGW